MNPQIAGILTGGIGAAVFFGVGNLLVKFAQQTGLSLGYYVLALGLGTCALALPLIVFGQQRSFITQGALWAFGQGVCSAAGISLVWLALHRFQTPLSTLNPIYNANTFITVLLALWIFAEWRSVSAPRLVAGAVCIILGSVLVARA